MTRPSCYFAHWRSFATRAPIALARILLATSMTSLASAVNPSRLAALTRLRCAIFQTSYNPTSARTGAKYLRARLRGPSMVQYYPQELSVAKFNRMSHGEFKIADLAEAQRLTNIEALKKRGKGAPKKARTKGVLAVVSSMIYVSDTSVLKDESRRVKRRK